MSCLGVHFAITPEEENELRELIEEAMRLEHLREVIEPRYFEEHPDLMAESGKSWDAMHRTLTDGHLFWIGGGDEDDGEAAGKGEYPLTHVVLYGEVLFTEPHYIISYKSPQQVRDIAAALPAITQEEFRRRFFAIKPENLGYFINEEEFEYTWENFLTVRTFYLRASEAGRAVIFTADQ
ncbi:YfbM family protein [Prosthecobacter sp.]|uniref:YfbM family protein n=1 Tax=Prosthecobacter sp. TaxID=1965333 RepID=UPI0037845F7C